MGPIGARARRGAVDSGYAVFKAHDRARPAHLPSIDNWQLSPRKNSSVRCCRVECSRECSRNEATLRVRHSYPRIFLGFSVFASLPLRRPLCFAADRSPVRSRFSYFGVSASREKSRPDPSSAAVTFKFRAYPRLTAISICCVSLHV